MIRGIPLTVLASWVFGLSWGIEVQADKPVTYT